MWGRRRRRAVRVTTLIGRGTTVVGDVRFRGGLHVDGVVSGNIVAEEGAEAMLTVSEEGRIEGEVRVPVVVLNGTVLGDVHAGEHIELAPKARVSGNVYYGVIEMAAGAEVNGSLVHAPAGGPAGALTDGRERAEAAEEAPGDR
ncbi:bactofilin family protein [Inmirania thermothiophila]|uniref:Cytoskeletal protein CcmA (Bactofilin family) n=1 Tax=Inmirania thermothiophila TaxID=1750597 RepID=A0A3N1XST7_9GAMM|nr:polymer-forming cytoskeletal protein [Inmirania thermothiophila]ROR29714.1 cytoskeletal protein CcmA (bactofilin family) [Inmirania thermothiophila]